MRRGIFWLAKYSCCLA